MAIDVTSYMNELAEAAGIAPEQRPSFLSNDKVKALAHRSLEAVEREKGRAEAERLQRQKEYEENLRIFNNNKAAVEAAEQQVKAYEARFGKLDPAARAAAVEQVAQGIDQKTLDERVGKAEGMALEMAKIASTIGLDYYKRFGEVLDFDAVQKIAVEKGLNAKQAYDEFIRPRNTEAEKARYDAEKKAEYERGLAEGASRRAAGAISDASPQNGFMSNFSKKADAQQAPNPASAFAEAWTGWKPQQK